MKLGCEWRHARKQGAEIFGDFWKRRQLRFDSGAGSPTGKLTAGDVGTVSIVKIVYHSLSLLVSKD